MLRPRRLHPLEGARRLPEGARPAAARPAGREELSSCLRLPRGLPANRSTRHRGDIAASSARQPPTRFRYRPRPTACSWAPRPTRKRLLGGRLRGAGGLGGTRAGWSGDAHRCRCDLGSNSSPSAPSVKSLGGSRPLREPGLRRPKCTASRSLGLPVRHRVCTRPPMSWAFLPYAGRHRWFVRSAPRTRGSCSVASRP